jgi:hypothetical protein
LLLGTILLADESGASTWAVPTWTDKEVLIALGSAVGALIPVMLFVIKIVASHLRQKLRVARQEVDRLKALIGTDSEGRDKQLKEIIEQLDEARQQAGQFRTEADQFRKEVAVAKDQAATHLRHATELKANLDSLTGKLGDYETQLEAERRRLASGAPISKKGGGLPLPGGNPGGWTQKPPSCRLRTPCRSSIRPCRLERFPHLGQAKKQLLGRPVRRQNLLPDQLKDGARLQPGLAGHFRRGNQRLRKRCVHARQSATTATPRAN